MRWICPIRGFSKEDRLALVGPDRQLTFAGLDAAIDHGVSLLATAGVGAGDRVAIDAELSAATPIWIWACWRLGAIAFPVDPLLPEANRDELLARVAPKIWVTPIEGLPRPVIPPDAIFFSSNSDAPLPPLGGSDDPLATMIATSGTTGEPKLAVLRLRSHKANAEAYSALSGLGPDSRYLLSLPLFHISGVAIVARIWMLGGTLVIPSKERRLLENVADFGITHISVVETQVRRMFDLAPHLGRPIPLKHILLGGAPVGGHWTVPDAMADCRISVGYGLTETGSFIAASDPKTLTRFAASPIQARIQNGQLRINESGEIEVAGERLFAGYWRDGLLDLPLTSDGWFKTGDMGLLNGDSLRILGRVDDRFFVGGENVHPEEIEAVILRLPMIAQVVVVAVADPQWGHRPIAVVRCHDDVLADEGVRSEIAEAISRQLQPFKHPKVILNWPSHISIAGLKANRKAIAEWLLAPSCAVS